MLKYYFSACNKDTFEENIGTMRIFHYTPVLLILLSGFCLYGQVGQVDIPRIDLMPDQPTPYSMRDWKKVARQYDSLIYNIHASGQYLPLISLRPAGFNYPDQQFYNMQTYVGSKNTSNNEAINSLPSLVGATLVGIDKSDQFGKNWVMMSQDFFNVKNGENIYLNGNNTSSGHDWWYDMMPNVYFYQLADLYPNIGGEKDTQFITIADRMLEAVKKMGGSDHPWSYPNMNYRAWNFKTMEPLDEGVIEPEAAGAFAWILYNAYTKTGHQPYLSGALWSLDFLNQLNQNPSYELQLPYGTYIAARMNAEIGTNYNIEKMINWSFDRGPLRGWGTIVGKWGGLDVSGLVGEANDNGNDYAFQLNGVQQAAALVPMVRYDKRFAKAIGKWTLNIANATRLFYPGFLPSHLQDGSEWSDEYDPDRVIGYEALREKWNGNSPFSTGDALKSGWAATNLSLYSTSSIGYLGAIISTTDVDKILQLDLTKTDFYQEKSYPTYLYYNPYSQGKSITIDLGAENKSIYEAISESMPIENKSGNIQLSIPAQSAIIVTIIPPNPSLEYNENKLLANGIIIDYRQTKQSFTYTPKIIGLAPEFDTIELSNQGKIFAKILDKDSDQFTYYWTSTAGVISGDSMTVTWTAPDTEGAYTISLIVEDESGNRDTLSTKVVVIREINVSPVIDLLSYTSIYTQPGGQINLEAIASDANGDELSYSWTADSGTFSDAQNPKTIWTAPDSEGIYNLEISVTDPGGLATEKSIVVLVKKFEDTQGELVAWYPFSNNVLDSTTYHHDGILSGPLFVNDLWGHSRRALQFDGTNDYIKVNATAALNFQNEITVSCWIKPGTFPERESFIISHGSWQNRWKLSLTPEHLVRWTVHTDVGIVDVDAPEPLVSGQPVYLTATYDGKIMMIYINGEPVAFKPHTGKILQTNIPLTIGQMTPDEANYNFKGLIDEAMIYNHSLIPDAIKQLFQSHTSETHRYISGHDLIAYPNPASVELMIKMPVNQQGNKIWLMDINGKIIKTIYPDTFEYKAIDITSLQSGFYLIGIETSEGIYVQKWIKK